MIKQIIEINLILFISVFGNIFCSGQRFERVNINDSDSLQLYINDGNSNQLYYLKMVPKTDIKGAVVILPSGGETTEDLIRQIEIPQLAYKNGIATIIPSINWGTENRDIEHKMLDKIFEDIVDKYYVPKANFVLGGLSNGGMIALTYAQQAIREKSTYLVPKGVFGLDVPLDKTHMYEYCEREIKRNFSNAGMNEARWIMNRFNKIYGGSPSEYPDRYVAASIYSNGVENGGNVQYLKNVPIRMYTDLDVNWLLNE
jgi:hypothetical protein